MRTIKFRGRSCGEWYYGNLHIRKHEKFGDSAYIIGYTETPSTTIVDINTIGQFTGLHDKNGKEIYGGDIVKHTLFDFYDNEEQHKSVVEYCDGMAAFFVKLSEDSDCGNYLELGWVYQEDNEIEVIGNIHDNPELLKTTNY
jgi:uncharacterized phage protein (TIGR01671 family)